ncbi:hypothetical protein HN512_02095 [Candidatus Peregrinibacteria bacterium]|nr:hypothetical protein [Candidatus Peregrinibacteria bacterium]MBT3598605.1 hypothetical protein [Candidatus Peregrinibacteria bacterium]MBT4367020.1 hypothetical protein [Candidatus Peregrinibacteria bacterium]MBT4586125.1 hypothetical protein [Candidatus Peregrinibacteria bacterium]MBT6730600.1 hypothetical protein [Candidatus Peregrinibacteria bacterium]
MTGTSTPEKGKSVESNLEQSDALIVSQPKKLEGLLETISLIDKVSEKLGEDKSGDMGSGGQTSMSKSSKSSSSSRAQAIANLPEPRVMQKSLEKHIHHEVKLLQKKVKKITKESKEGNAHKLNELYAHMRRLNGILSELVEASYDIVKRLYVRIFVDKQNIT